MAHPTTKRAARRSDDELRREARIARGLARQDAGALEELYELTGRACFAVVLGVVRDHGHAEDVQQQVYAELWRRASEFDVRRGTLLAWVLTVARSRALDHLRRRTEQPVEAEVLAALGGAGDDRGYDDLIRRVLVAEALTTLPDRERELLRLRFWDGLSQAEIADQTDIPLGTVKSRMTSGLARLKQFLAEHEGAA